MTRLTDLPGVQAAPSLSPDGKQLLYVSRDGGDRDIFLQRVGGENPVNLTADSPGNDFAPSFSPDGETIAFNSDRGGGGIFIMGATGESPRRVSDHGYHPSWTPDGRRLLFTTEWVTTIFGRSTLADLWEIDGETREAKLLFDGDASHARMSPGGRRIAYWTWWGRTQGQRDIWTVAADGSDPQPVTEDVPTDWNPWWSPDGKWLFFISDRGGSPDLWRVAIDEATGRPLGEPMAVTTGVASVADAGFSADGRRVAVTVDSAAGRLESVAFDPDGPRIVGEPTTLFSSGNAFNQMDLSRDGQWLAIRTTAPRETIYVMRTDGSGRRRLIDDEHRNRGPRWSPDGRWIVFYSNRTGAYELWATRSDGTEAKQLTVTEKTDLTNPVWSPDGRQIRATAVDADGSKVVRFDLPAEGIDGVDGPLVPNEVSLEVEVIGMRWSPDGKWIVGPDVATQAVVQYSPESGKYETVRDAEGVLRWGEFAGDWIDTSHFALWDDERQSAWVWDATTRTTRKLAGIEHPSDLRFGPDGRTLYLNRTINEGDVWLLTLDE
jgi:Tol biopolymer transport system component